jgi:hypothetical protein
MAGLRPDDLQRFAVDSGRIQPKIEGALAFGQALRPAALSASSSASSWADPKCSIRREPRRVDHTICTAIAPEAVFTVRTYAITAPYE